MKKDVICIKCGIPIASFDLIDNNSRFFSLSFMCNGCDRLNTQHLTRGVIELGI